MGIPCFQNPLDLWIIQEIIHETKPTIIIECGSAMGGTSMFLAHVLDNANLPGNIFSIDVGDNSKASHRRITKLVGMSTAAMTFNIVNDAIGKDDEVMVILDSDHSTENVLKEMQIYSNVVTPGCYMIIQDSNIGGNPVNLPSLGPGPMQAIYSFLKLDDRFEIDITREKFYFTFCPNGWLKRKA
jgi:cephalosporin hydroxylase